MSNKIKNVPNRWNPPKEIMPDIGVAISGVILLILCFVSIELSEQPNDLMKWLIRTIASLATAASSIALPGFINLETMKTDEGKKDTLWPKIKAGGALAIFVLVYLFNPID